MASLDRHSAFIALLTGALTLALASACGSESTPGATEPGAPASTNWATQTVAKQPDSQLSEVVVLGLIHGRHRQSQTYGLDRVRALIRAIEPDVVVTEIPPDRLQKALDEFRTTGAVTEPRVKVFPEYTDALFPLSPELSFTIEPAAAWTQAMAKDRRAKLSDWKVTRAEDSKRVAEAQDRAVERIRAEGLNDDPWGMHGARYDQLVAEGMRPYDKLFNDDLGAGGWGNINAAHIALVQQALDRHKGQGKRILITFGAWHKYQFLRALTARPDIRLRSVREFLAPPPDSQSSPSDVAHARQHAAHQHATTTRPDQTAPAPSDSGDRQNPVDKGDSQSQPAIPDSDILPVQNCRIIHGEKIHFQYDKARIMRKSYAVLDRIVETLRARPAWKVRIEGHRDSRGEYYRVRITRRRANSVRDYLVSKGIDPARLVSVGYGDSRPIATNKTKAGRAQNRRIELHLEDCP